MSGSICQIENILKHIQCGTNAEYDNVQVLMRWQGGGFAPLLDLTGTVAVADTRSWLPRLDCLGKSDMKTSCALSVC